jgi:hypothetical protein
MRSKNIASACGGNRKQSDQLKDEVYRQMFRLEAGRQGAASQLAVALLRAWIALDTAPRTASDRQWLRQICPVCLGLLESADAVARSGTRCSS